MVKLISINCVKCDMRYMFCTQSKTRSTLSILHYLKVDWLIDDGT